MKIFIIITHILIGLVLIFMVYSPMGILSKINNPEGIWPDSSVSQIVTKYVGGIIIGLFSILGAIAFKKGKKWATFVLPAVTLILILMMLVPVITADSPSTYAWTGGPIILLSLILFTFFVSETIHMVLRKRTLIQ